MTGAANPLRVARRLALDPAWGLALIHLGLFFLLVHAPEYLLDGSSYEIHALRIRHGQVPYRDFFLNAGPGYGYMAAALESIFGPGPLVRRTLLWLAVGSSYALAARAAWPFAGRGSLWLAGIALAAMSPAFTRFHHPNHDTIFWVSVALWLLVAARGAPDERGKRRALFLAGLAAGTSVLFKQSIGLAACAGVVLSAALLAPLEGRGRRGLGEARAVAVAAAGCAVPVSAFVLWLVSRGLFWSFIECAVLSPSVNRGISPARNAFVVTFAYVSQPGSLGLLAGVAAATLLRGRARALVATVTALGAALATGHSVVDFVRGAGGSEPGTAAIGFCVGLGALSLVGAVRGDPTARARVGLWVVFLAPVMGASMTGPARAAGAVPLALPLLAAALEDLSSTVPPGRTRTVLRGSFALAVAAFGVWGGLAARELYPMPIAPAHEPRAVYHEPALEGIEDAADLVHERAAVIDFLNRNLRDDETFFAYPNEEYLYISVDRTPPGYASMIDGRPLHFDERLDERFESVRFFVVTTTYGSTVPTPVLGTDSAEFATNEIARWILAHAQRVSVGRYVVLYVRTTHFRPEAVALPPPGTRRSLAAFASAVAGRAFGEEEGGDSTELRAWFLARCAQSPALETGLRRWCADRCAALVPPGTFIHVAAAYASERDAPLPTESALERRQRDALSRGQVVDAYVASARLIDLLEQPPR
jgi:hypothetical protein